MKNLMMFLLIPILCYGCGDDAGTSVAQKQGKNPDNGKKEGTSAIPDKLIHDLPWFSVSTFRAVYHDTVIRLNGKKRSFTLSEETFLYKRLESHNLEQQTVVNGIFSRNFVEGYAWCDTMMFPYSISQSSHLNRNVISVRCLLLKDKFQDMAIARTARYPPNIDSVAVKIQLAGFLCDSATLGNDKDLSGHVFFTESYPPGSYEFLYRNHLQSYQKTNMDSSRANVWFNITYPTISPGTDRATAAFVNETMNEILRGGFKTYQAQRSDFFCWADTNYCSDPEFCSDVISIVHNSNDLIFFEQFFIYPSGPFHLLETYYYCMLDLKNKKQIKIENVFRQGYEPIIKKLIVKHFGIEGEDGKKHLQPFETEPLTHNILLTKKGISFIYNPYEISDYSSGTIVFSLPWNEVEKILILDKSFIQRL